MQRYNHGFGRSLKPRECLSIAVGNVSCRYRPWIPCPFQCPWSWHGEWLRQRQFWISSAWDTLIIVTNGP